MMIATSYFSEKYNAYLSSTPFSALFLPLKPPDRAILQGHFRPFAHWTCCPISPILLVNSLQYSKVRKSEVASAVSDAFEAQRSSMTSTTGTRKLGIFGGTSLLRSSVFSNLEPKIVVTPHGSVVIHVDPRGVKPLVFIQRHHADGDAGAEVYRPPHLINHKANIAAMVQQGVDKIVAVCCVGSLSEDITIGTVVIPDDYFYMFGPPVSYYDDARAHIVPGIDLDLRAEIIEALEEGEVSSLSRKPAVYVQTVGPRFETRAEVKFLAPLGDVIGMTAASEATMAKENCKPYVIFAMVDNMAHGLAGSQLTHEQFKANVAKNQSTVERGVAAILRKLLP